MAQLSKSLTRRIALNLHRNEKQRMPWDQLRDVCDVASDGDLDCFQLDTLTDWVEDDPYYQFLAPVDPHQPAS